MKVLVYDAHSYDREFLEVANAGRHQLEFTTAQLDVRTAQLARGYRAVSLFVNDDASAAALEVLAAGGTRLLAQRSTGYNNIDLAAAAHHGIAAARVSSYSPYSVAEFAVGMLMTVNRRLHRAYNRTREFNFRLAGLMGSDIHGRTVGVVGTGKIGAVFARIMHGFGCRLLGYDSRPSPECLALGMEYRELDALLPDSDIVSLHVPLVPDTRHLLDRRRLALMKTGSFLVNTSRGALIDTEALVDLLRDERFAGVALDVYEEEEGKFFQDLSNRVMPDQTLALLMTFPNVLVTSHQAFFTREAFTTIAETTIRNLTDFEEGRENDNMLRAQGAGRP